VPFDNAIPAWVASETTSRSPTTVVDQWTGDQKTWHGTNAHPHLHRWLDIHWRASTHQRDL
jgi:hypothetical protein